MKTVLFFALALFSTVLAAGQTPTVANSQLVLQQGRHQIEVFIAIEPIDNSVKPGDLKLNLSDESTLSGHVLSLAEPPKYIGGNGKKGYWRSIWNIPGPGLGFGETHLILVKSDSFSGIVTITIQPSSDPQVTLTGPKEMKLHYSRNGQLRITTTAPLSGITANWSSLISSDSGQQILPTMLRVSNQPGGASGAEVTRKTEVVYLLVDPNFMTAGKFQGTVSLTSFQKPELGSFDLTVYSTSLDDQLIGLALLAVGVAIYFVIAIWAKGRSRKLAAMLPAARLRDQATQLVVLLKNAEQVSGYSFTTLLGPVGNPGSLLDVLNKLSEQSLQSSGYIPSSIGNPFAAQDLPGPYQAFLVTISNQMSAFALIVQWGVTQVIAMWPQVQKASVEVAGKAALGALENLAIQPFPPGALQMQIQTVIKGLQSAILGAAPAGGGAVSIGGYGISGSHEILVQQEQLSAFVWIMWGIVTLIIGSSALIWFNDGFGTTQDMVKCFLWGLGMPAVAGGLGGLTLGSVASTFSLQTIR